MARPVTAWAHVRALPCATNTAASMNNTAEVRVGGEDLCYSLSKPEDISTFPSVTYTMEGKSLLPNASHGCRSLSLPLLAVSGGGKFSVKPQHVFFQMAWDNGNYCLGFYNNGRGGTVIGANSMMGHEFRFDLAAKTVTITASTCTAAAPSPVPSPSKSPSPRVVPSRSPNASSEPSKVSTCCPTGHWLPRLTRGLHVLVLAAFRCLVLLLLLTQRIKMLQHYNRILFLPTLLRLFVTRSFGQTLVQEPWWKGCCLLMNQWPGALEST